MIYEFAATQDLHGYSEPWAPGAGANKFGPNEDAQIDYYINAGGTASYSPNWCISDYIAVTPETEYSFTPHSTYGDAAYYAFYDSSKELISVIESHDVLVTYHGTFTTPEDASFMRFSYRASSYDIQLELGSSISSDYTPYANVCMPEGFNIWDPTNQKYVQVYAGYVNANTRELYLRPVYEEYAGEELVGPWMSSLDPYSEDATPTEGAFVIDFGGELTSLEITPFMLQTLLDSLGIRQHFTDGAGLLNKLMDQAQGRVRSEEELLHLSRPLNVIAIGDQLPAGLTFKPISKDVLPGLPGKFIR